MDKNQKSEEILKKLFEISMFAEAHGELTKDQRITFIAQTVMVVMQAGLEYASSAVLHRYITLYLLERSLINRKINIPQFLMHLNPISLN